MITKSLEVAMLVAGVAAASGCDGDPGTEHDADADTDVDTDADSDTDTDVDTECDEPTSGPTTHDGVSADETWTADASPHLVPADMNVNAGVTLTIEACAEVRIAPDKTITVRGTMIADGTAQRPVLITADGGEPWASLRNYGGTSSIRLTHTTVEGGGDPGSTIPDYAGMIVLQGDATQPTQGLLHVDHVTVRGSGSNGIALLDGAGFSDESTAITITGSAQYPVSLWVPALGTLPEGNYSGNAKDEILTPAHGGYEIVVRDLTIRDRGVPYRVGASNTVGEIVVDAGAAELATLTIESGVTLRFVPEGALLVEYDVGGETNGALVAVGTAADPITFTSAADAPAAGDWRGVYFGSTPNPTSRMDYVVVDYAGGDSQSGSSSCVDPGEPINDAAIRVMSGDPPAAFVTNATLSNSAGHGIDRGWTGTPVDFLPTNDFVNVARCRQTTPDPGAAACPDPACE